MREQTNRKTLATSISPIILIKIGKYLQHLLVAGAVLYPCVYIMIVTLRIGYPFELEKMEGGTVDHVARILSGNKLYVSPSLEFVAYAYTPLYMYLSAGLAQVLGVGFFAPRLVSVIASVGCFLLIFLFVRNETKDNFASLLSCCLFAATFRISGAWFDIARVDSLFLFFLLVGTYMVRFYSSWESRLIAGLFISLSFLTKQTAMAISLPIMLFCILEDKRKGLWFLGTVAVLIGLSTIILNYIHDGWYDYYVFQLQANPPITISRFGSFWIKDLFSVLSIAIVIALFHVLICLCYASKGKYLFYLFMVLGFIGGSWLSRLSYLQFDNVLFPAYAIVSILFGLGIHECIEKANQLTETMKSIIKVCLYFAATIQFASLMYNPLTLIPTRDDLYAGIEFINKLRSIPGDVLLVHHGYLSTLAGKESHAQGVAISDVILRDSGSTGKTKLVTEIREAIRGKRFAAIILDTGWWFQDDIEKHYRMAGSVFERQGVF